MNSKATSNGRAVLYYDGACPLCMKEMARLGRIKSEELQLADIHDLPPSDDLPGKDTLLRTLHLRQPDGELVTGIEANVSAWDYTPYGRWLQWLRWPLVRSLAGRIYTRWAAWRYTRLYAGEAGADDAAKIIPTARQCAPPE